VSSAWQCESSRQTSPGTSNSERCDPMEILGIVFLILVAVAIVAGLIIFFIALPDIARYRRLRRM